MGELGAMYPTGRLGYLTYLIVLHPRKNKREKKLRMGGREMSLGWSDRSTYWTIFTTAYPLLVLKVYILLVKKNA